MRIAFVIGLYPHQIGGAEMQAREIATVFKQCGHEIFYVCYSCKEYCSEEFFVDNISVRNMFDIFYFGTWRNLSKSLDKIKPDLVYHRAFVPYSCYIANWCINNKVPFYFHSADVFTLIRKNNSLKNIILNKMLVYTLNKATGIICQNMEQYQALKYFNLKNIRIIYNIHQTNIHPINMSKKKNIIWIAKFEPEKQPQIFIDFAERFKDSDVTFTMFSSKCSQSVINKNLLKRIKNNSQIELVEGKDNDYINNYLCDTASVLINTSVSEGISNTFIQAWMRGVPVISLNSNPDGWFDNNEIGGCCNGDPLRIDEIVSYLFRDDNYERISRNSVIFAEKLFSQKVITPQLIEFMKI